MSSYNKEWRERNPHKVKAHTDVQYALRKGLLVKQPCQKCGNSKSAAHHDDYSKTLEVRWLCSVCHHEHHKLMRVSGVEPPVRKEYTLNKSRHTNPLKASIQQLRLEGKSYTTIARLIGLSRSQCCKLATESPYN